MKKLIAAAALTLGTLVSNPATACTFTEFGLSVSIHSAITRQMYDLFNKDVDQFKTKVQSIEDLGGRIYAIRFAEEGKVFTRKVKIVFKDHQEVACFDIVVERMD